jgi:outer membrane scaffolding protein for murein synthesis (MipA/OmpV family)
VIQITFLNPELTAADQTRGMMKPVIIQQIVMNLSILAVVMLSLHNFITNLTAGRFGVEVHESTDERSKTSGAKSRRRTVVSKAQHDSHLRPGESSASFRPGRSNKSKAWAQAGEASEWEDSDRVSHGSQENIIMQTMTWQVSRNDEAVGSSVPSREAEVETPPLEREVGKARAIDSL